MRQEDFVSSRTTSSSSTAAVAVAVAAAFFFPLVEEPFFLNICAATKPS